METIKVNVYVSKESAIARNCAQYGKYEVELKDEDIAGLSEPAKKELLHHNYGLVDVSEATVANLQIALETLASKRADEESRRKEREEEDIQKFLSLKWSPDTYKRPTNDWVYRMNNLPSDDPRVQAKNKALLAELAEAQAAWDRTNTERLKESERREARFKELTCNYVQEHIPEYARAAKEGCDVTHKAIKHHTELLFKVFAGATAYKYRTYGKDRLLTNAFFKGDNRGEPQQTPSNHAYAIRDAILSALQVPEMQALDVAIDVSIVRVDLSDFLEDCDECSWSTAIRAEARYPNGERYYAHMTAEGEDLSE